MMPFENNFEVAQPNYGWGFYNSSTYSPPSPWFQEFVYNEPCPICSSYYHIFTECPKAHEFSEFVQKYNNTTQYQPPHWRNEDNKLRTKVTNIEQQLGKMNSLLENLIIAQQTQERFSTQPNKNLGLRIALKK